MKLEDVKANGMQYFHLVASENYYTDRYYHFGKNRSKDRTKIGNILGGGMIRPTPSASRRQQNHDLHGGLGVVVMVDKFRRRFNENRAHGGR